jgi:hypothetical protein
MEDALEAAQRYRLHHAIRGPHHQLSPYFVEGEGLDYNYIRHDEWLMRDAYLTEHPADDPKVIDEEWLQIMGKSEGLSNCISYIVGEFTQSGCVLTTVRVVHLDSNPPLWTVEIAQHESGKQPRWSLGVGVIVSTRRQLRNLLEALKWKGTSP